MWQAFRKIVVALQIRDSAPINQSINPAAGDALDARTPYEIS
jgi:hypothetical protein